MDKMDKLRSFDFKHWPFLRFDSCSMAESPSTRVVSSTTWKRSCFWSTAARFERCLASFSREVQRQSKTGPKSPAERWEYVRLLSRSKLDPLHFEVFIYIQNGWFHIPFWLVCLIHGLRIFLKIFPGFAPAEDLGMRHISFVVVASLERPRGDTLWIFIGSFRSIFLVPMMFVGARSWSPGPSMRYAWSAPGCTAQLGIAPGVTP